MDKPFGLIRLHALPAPDVWRAQSTVTEHVAGPRSTATVALAAGALRQGDVAGLALFERPYAWVGVERGRHGLHVAQFDEQTGMTSRVPLRGARVWLRVDCDFPGTHAAFSFSPDGTAYTRIGPACPVPSTGVGFESVPCSLFSCSASRAGSGGHADFESFVVTTEPARPW